MQSFWPAILSATGTSTNSGYKRTGEKIPSHLRGCSEVVNERNGELMKLWKVLQAAAHLLDGGRLHAILRFPFLDLDSHARPYHFTDDEGEVLFGFSW